MLTEAVAGAVVCAGAGPLSLMVSRLDIDATWAVPIVVWLWIHLWLLNQVLTL